MGNVRLKAENGLLKARAASGLWREEKGTPHLCRISCLASVC
jgi:hypothetical protein